MHRRLIILTLVIGLLAPFVGLNLYSYDLERRTLENSFRVEMQRITRAVAIVMSDPLNDRRANIAQRSLRSFMEDPRVLGIVVRSDRDGVFLSTGESPTAAAAVKAITQKVLHDGVPIGDVTVHVSTKTIRETLTALERHIAIATLIQFGFTLVIAGFAVWLYGRLQRVNAQREAERSVAEIEQRFLAALENVPVGIALYDEDEKLIFANDMYRLTGHEAGEALVPGTSFESFVRARVRNNRIPVDAVTAEAWAADRLERFRSAPSFGEAVYDDFVYQVEDQRLRDGSTLVLISNITEMKRREEELRQAQKMEAVGQLTGGIAHDFNNLMGVMVGHLEYLADEVDKTPAIAAHLDPVIRAAHRGTALTQRLLAFSRRQMLRPEATDVNRLISGMSDMLTRTLGERIEIETRLADGGWRARVDPLQLETAILNLALNSRDAMTDGGRLIIETRDVTLSEDELDGMEGLQPGDYIAVSITDEGSGMTPKVMEHAFEPFFTTKETGKGSGLGLSMVFGFAKQSCGHVSVDSAPGRGTTIRIYLPKAIDEPTEHQDIQAPLAEPSEPDFATGRILVVEDDRDIRNLTATMLARIGYEVTVADSAEAALTIAANSVMPYDLVLTDVVLPGDLSGVALAKRLVGIAPATRVLFMSGYAEHAIFHEHDTDRDVKMIGKPFQRAQLARAVEDALTTSSTASGGN